MAIDWAMAVSPDEAAIETLALAAIEALPTPYRVAARAVLLRIADLPDDAMLDDLGIEDPLELTGLYEGIPLTQKSAMDQQDQPDMIWLFRRAILDEWADREGTTLGDLVAHILVHELAHHFGWSDAEIAQVDRWWD